MKVCRHWTFLKDDLVEQTSESTKAGFQKKSWIFLEASLNLLGHLWWGLKMMLAVGKSRSIPEPQALVHEEWAKIP